MRILFLNYEYPPLGGGAANANYHLLKEFSRQGIVVDLVTSSVSDQYVREYLGESVTIHRLPIGKDANSLNYQTQKELLIYTWKAYWFARTLCKKHKYDLTHSFFAVPCGFLSLLLQWECALPYVVSLRGADVPLYSERFTFLYHVITPLIRKIWKNASHVVTNSVGLTALAQASAPQQRFREILNGVDTDFYTPKHNANTQEFTILTASRLSGRKRIRDIIDAFAIVYKKHPHTRLTISGGEGNAQKALKQQVQDLQLSDVVTFTGHYTKEQSASIYHGADVFVMASLNEGMSNNLLEALASGLPILMTPTGGAMELIHNECNGYIVPFKNPKAIAAKLALLIADKEKTVAFGKASRIKAADLTWSSAAQRYVELYKKM